MYSGEQTTNPWLRLIAAFAHYHHAQWRVYENEVPPLKEPGDTLDAGRCCSRCATLEEPVSLDSFATVILQGRS